MASKQSEAVRRRWEAAMLAVAHPGGEGLVDDESWGDLTSEPREVDYLETEAGGLPAMWVVPKRARDRVLLCLHGGGFLSGSISRRRKMFAHMAKAAGSRALLVGYRLLGEGGAYPMPAVEVVSVYRWLLEQGLRPLMSRSQVIRPVAGWRSPCSYALETRAFRFRPRRCLFRRL